jgi:hypothetical protein
MDQSTAGPTQGSRARRRARAGERTPSPVDQTFSARSDASSTGAVVGGRDLSGRSYSRPSKIRTKSTKAIAPRITPTRTDWRRYGPARRSTHPPSGLCPCKGRADKERRTGPVLLDVLLHPPIGALRGVAKAPRHRYPEQTFSKQCDLSPAAHDAELRGSAAAVNVCNHPHQRFAEPPSPSARRGRDMRSRPRGRA